MIVQWEPPEQQQQEHNTRGKPTKTVAETAKQIMRKPRGKTTRTKTPPKKLQTKNGKIIIPYRNMEQMQQRTKITTRQIAQIQQRNKQPPDKNIITWARKQIDEHLQGALSKRRNIHPDENATTGPKKDYEDRRRTNNKAGGKYKEMWRT